MHHACFVHFFVTRHEFAGIQNDFRPAFIPIQIQVQNQHARLYRDRQPRAVIKVEIACAVDGLFGEKQNDPLLQARAFAGIERTGEAVIGQRALPLGIIEMRLTQNAFAPTFL